MSNYKLIKMRHFLVFVILSTFLIVFNELCSAQTVYVEKFDIADYWSGGTMTGYNAKYYINPDDPFKGYFSTNAAVRETSYTISDYAWRLDDLEGAYLRYSCHSTIDSFKFFMTRWDNSPLPQFSIRISNNGGISFVELFEGDGNLFNSDKEYLEFEFNGMQQFSDSTVIVEIRNLSGERLLFDNFSFFTTITSVDTIPPVARWDLANESVNVKVDRYFELEFLEEVYKNDGITRIDSIYLMNNISFVDSTLNNQIVPFEIQDLENWQRIDIVPINLLEKGHVYKIVIDSIFDQSLNLLSDSLFFQTEEIKPEPTNHPLNFSLASLTYNSFELVWEIVASETLPDGFLLLINADDSFVIEDGEMLHTDSVYAGSMIPVYVSNEITSFEGNNLLPNAIYTIQIFPFTNENELIDYKTDGEVPFLNFQTKGLPKIVFSEIASLGYDASYKNEYIELYNADTITYDLSNFRLEYYENELEKAFALYDTISAGESVIISSRSEISLEETQSIFAEFFSMNMPGYFRLLDSNNLLIDKAGDSLQPFPDGNNYIFFDYNLKNDSLNDWFNLGIQNGSPGKKNSRWFNEIIDFTFEEIKEIELSEISAETSTINISVPFGTDLTALTPIIIFSDSAYINPQSGVEQSFLDTVIYVVTAENGDQRTWQVIVLELLNTENNIISFEFSDFELPIIGLVNDSLNKVELQVPFGTNVSALIPTIKISEQAEVIPKSGLPRDFTNSVYYELISQSGESEFWEVLVDIAPDTSKEMSSFALLINESLELGVIDSIKKEILVNVDFGTNLREVISIFISTGQEVIIDSIIQESGISKNDFSDIVWYEVIAEDLSSTSYKVLVIADPPSNESRLSMIKIDGINLDFFDKDIYAYQIELPFGTDIIPEITCVFLDSTSSITVLSDSVFFNDLLNGILTIDVLAQDENTTSKYQIEFLMGKNNDVSISSSVYTIDEQQELICGIDYNVRVEEFKRNFNLAYGAVIQVYQADTLKIADTLKDGTILKVSAEDQINFKYYTIYTSEAPNLFISEYLEGSSFNKAIELYNPTTQSLDLKNYYLAIAENGQNFKDTLFLEGRIEPETTVAICNKNADEQLKMFADYIDTISTVLNFNGNDCVALFDSSGLLDVIGEIGEYPEFAWTVDSISNATKDHTLRRMQTISTGNSNWYISSNLMNEWRINKINDYSNIGIWGKSSECDFLAYSIPLQNGNTIIDTVLNEIKISVYSTIDLSNSIADFQISRNAKVYMKDIEQVSAYTSNNYMDTLLYKVIAENGRVKIWKVMLNMEQKLSDQNEIESFYLNGINCTTYINKLDHSVIIDITDSSGIYFCKPEIHISEAAKISPDTSHFQNFSQNFNYLITAEDSSQQIWTIIPQFKIVPVLTIKDIQYSEYYPYESPYINQKVETSGIITHIGNGTIYMQDTIDMWSGISISANVDSFTIGNNISVESLVSELNGITELKDVKILNYEEGLKQIEPILRNSANAFDESLESVLVKYENMQYIGFNENNTSYLFQDDYGQITISNISEELYVGRFYDILGIPLTGLFNRIIPLSVRENVGLGIDKINQNIRIYPNPVNDFLIISLENGTCAEFEIYNSDGVLVMIGKLDQSHEILDLKNLTTGLYFIIFKYNAHLYMDKIIKQ